MDSMRGPSCQIHKERSPNKCHRPDFCHLSAGTYMYLKIGVKKTEIGAEHGALATLAAKIYVVTQVRSSHKFISTWVWCI